MCCLVVLGAKEASALYYVCSIAIDEVYKESDLVFAGKVKTTIPDQFIEYNAEGKIVINDIFPTETVRFEVLKVYKNIKSLDFLEYKTLFNTYQYIDMKKQTQPRFMQRFNSDLPLLAYTEPNTYLLFVKLPEVAFEEPFFFRRDLLNGYCLSDVLRREQPEFYKDFQRIEEAQPKHLLIRKKVKSYWRKTIKQMNYFFNRSENKAQLFGTSVLEYLFVPENQRRVIVLIFTIFISGWLGLRTLFISKRKKK